MISYSYSSSRVVMVLASALVPQPWILLLMLPLMILTLLLMMLLLLLIIPSSSLTLHVAPTSPNALLSMTVPHAAVAALAAVGPPAMLRVTVVDPESQKRSHCHAKTFSLTLRPIAVFYDVSVLVSLMM